MPFVGAVITPALLIGFRPDVVPDQLLFKRIQFTPDLLPRARHGIEVINSPQTNEREFKFLYGPL